MEIWHNPRCSKSRDAMTLLEEAGVDATERRYLDDEAMVSHPILIERPIVIAGDGRAVLGRPPEAIRQLLAGA